ncbi:MAG: ABC transporter substrate-binding protein, partial [Odoribacter sp.]|nr:ABC transporter substrate-binding protein [Odoribacter sp.]
KIERGKEDFDLVCPSDYIIERMLKRDLLLPINRDFGNTPDYIGNISPYINEELRKLDDDGKITTDYAVPYMWGTAGILYNTKFVPEEDVQSWGCLWNEKYKGRILMKDSYRDAYGTALIYAYHHELAEGLVTVDQLMNDYSPAAIDTVEVYLKKLKPNIAGWEADFGKEMMTKSKIYINMTWSGDAVWAMDEAEAVGVELDYVVPIEGSNVWYDGWVIPKYAQNIKAASYFINYMCRPDIAIRNMEEIGYVSAVATFEIMEYAENEDFTSYSDLSYFFGEGAEKMQVNPAMYPDRSVIERCAMIRDSGEHTEEVLDMWAKVKGDNLNPWILTIIFASFGALLIVGVYNKYKKYQRKKKKDGLKRKNYRPTYAELKRGS